jgi:hypothetical protein
MVTILSCTSVGVLENIEDKGAPFPILPLKGFLEDALGSTRSQVLGFRQFL